MRIVRFFFLTSLLISLSFAANSRIRNNAIVIKFTPGMLAQIDIQKARTQGLTGVAEIDDISSALKLTTLVQRYPKAKTVDIYNRPMNLRGWFKAYFAADIDVQNAVQQYKLINGVADAQVIGIHPMDVITPNDPRYTGGEMWYLNQSQDHDVDAPEAWDIERGNSNIIVADLDSGFHYYHKDLGGANASSANPENSRGNMWINYGEVGAGEPNGVDDDGNGKIDDWIGWDFVTGNPQNFNVGDDYDVEDNDPRDQNGHGTHTIGTIGAISNNGVGVASVSGGDGETNGVGNGIRAMGLRIGWDDIGGLGFVGMDFAANAFIYARDNGAKIASCSWGSSNTGGLGDAMNYFLYGTTTPTASDPQIALIFKAAGNDNNENSDYMLDRSDVIGVAATDSNDVKASFSTYGTFVDISAPGVDIMSTYHDKNNANADSYALESGTSMATPCTATIAALVWSHNQTLTASEVEQILYSTADDISGIAGNAAYAGKLGAGRVNAFKAVQQADQSLPVQLVSFGATVQQDGVLLSWETASELDNAGYAILRSNTENGSYEKLADYNDMESLRGLGTSSQGRSYRFIDSRVNVGETYWYKLQDVDFNGVSTEHGPVSVTVQSVVGKPVEGVVPDHFTLTPNFPNPFNPTTHFTLTIPKLQQDDLQVTVTVYDLLGKTVNTLYKGRLTSGTYQMTWDGRNSSGQNMPSGMYIYAVKTKLFNQSRKMVLLK